MQCSNGVWYTVQRGDTMYSIARRYGTTVGAISAANGITNPNNIYVGQRLWIPTGCTPPPPTTCTWYTVQKGDNLYQISKKFGVSVEAICAANGITDPNRVTAGQTLCIPTSGATPPPPLTPVPPVGSQGPWTGLYYSNKDLSGSPAFVRTDPAIDFYFGPGGPAPSTPAPNYSVLWTGTFNFTGGNYRFSVNTDDGARLYIDDLLHINGWRDQAPTGYYADVNLSAGNHFVRVEYYNAVGDGTIEVSWQPR